MTANNLIVDADAMRAVVAKAILDSLDTQQRETLITAALEHLITGPKDTYGRALPSPLEHAFQTAIERVAFDQAQTLLSEPEQLDRIRAVVNDHITKALGDTHLVTESVGFAIGNVLSKALRGEL